VIPTYYVHDYSIVDNHFLNYEMIEILIDDLNGSYGHVIGFLRQNAYHPVSLSNSAFDYLVHDLIVDFVGTYEILSIHYDLL
jgi:hypothetical protein